MGQKCIYWMLSSLREETLLSKVPGYIENFGVEGGRSRAKNIQSWLWLSVNFAISDKIQTLLPDLPDLVAMWLSGFISYQFPLMPYSSAILAFTLSIEHTISACTCYAIHLKYSYQFSCNWLLCVTHVTLYWIYQAPAVYYSRIMNF